MWKMTNVSTYNLPQMTDLVNRTFWDALDQLPQVMKNSWIVIQQDMPENTWESRRFAERLHRTPYASVRDEWSDSKQAQVQYGYEKDMQVYTVSLEESITKRMRTAGKEQNILDSITSLSEVCPNTIDLDLAHRLTFAFDTSYTRNSGETVDTTVWDGLALISNSHTLTGSATTYSNLIPGNPQCSKTAIENAEQLFAEETYDNLGNKMVITPNTIITTDDPNTINLVRELQNSTADVDANNGNSGIFNSYKNKYKHVVVPRLATTATGATDTTKRKQWFLASSKASDFYLCTLEEPYVKTPNEWNNGEDFSSENWSYLAAATYGIAIVTGRWIKGSTGNG